MGGRVGGRKDMVVCLSNEDGGRWCAREKERVEEQDGDTLEKSNAPKQRREPGGTAASLSHLESLIPV